MPVGWVLAPTRVVSGENARARGVADKACVQARTLRPEFRVYSAARGESFRRLQPADSG
jgi:hypothetical protein